MDDGAPTANGGVGAVRSIESDGEVGGIDGKGGNFGQGEDARRGKGGEWGNGVGGEGRGAE